MKFAGLFFLAIAVSSCSASQVPPPEEEGNIELGKEYVDYSKDDASDQEKSGSIARALILYFPNRVLDLIDIVKLDVGAGPALGAVVRITKWGQVGIRILAPVSLRVGLRGRHIPAFIEHSSELGVGPAFLASSQREITPLEVGLGGDLLFGAYAGVSLDELFDFLAGLIFLDPFGDDF